MEFDLGTKTSEPLIEPCKDFGHAYYLDEDIIFGGSCGTQSGIFRYNRFEEQSYLLTETERPQFELTPNLEEIVFNRANEDNISEVIVFDLTSGASEVAPHVEGYKDIGGSFIGNASELVSFISTRDGQPGFLYVWDRETHTVRPLEEEEQAYIVDRRWEVELLDNKATILDLQQEFDLIELQVPEGYRIKDARVVFLTGYQNYNPVSIP
jgi:hypothetical protein